MLNEWPSDTKFTRLIFDPYAVPVKSLDTHTTHSRVFLYFYYFLHCRRHQNYEITHMKSCRIQKSVKQIKIHFIFEILQSSHPLP